MGFADKLRFGRPRVIETADDTRLLAPFRERGWGPEQLAEQYVLDQGYWLQLRAVVDGQFGGIHRHPCLEAPKVTTASYMTLVGRVLPEAEALPEGVEPIMGTDERRVLDRQLKKLSQSVQGQPLPGGYSVRLQADALTMGAAAFKELRDAVRHAGAEIRPEIRNDSPSVVVSGYDQVRMRLNVFKGPEYVPGRISNRVTLPESRIDITLSSPNQAELARYVNSLLPKDKQIGLPAEGRGRGVA